MAKKKLQGQVAIITGAGRGIGAATARLLARAGAAVVLTARSADQIEAVAGELRAEGLRALAVTADVSDEERLEVVGQAALDEYGRVDILVNNAALIWPLEPVADADPEEWAYAIHVNLVGPFYMTRILLPFMLDNNFGRIVNVTSAAARLPIAGASAYCAAKAGLEQFTRTLAQELQGSRVAVNLYDPGMVDTEMQVDIRSVDAEEMGMDTSYFHRAHAEGWLRSAEEAAQGILWLVGPWAGGVSGESFSMDDDGWRAQVTAAFAA